MTSSCGHPAAVYVCSSCNRARQYCLHCAVNHTHHATSTAAAVFLARPAAASNEYDPDMTIEEPADPDMTIGVPESPSFPHIHRSPTRSPSPPVALPRWMQDSSASRAGSLSPVLGRRSSSIQQQQQQQQQQQGDIDTQVDEFAADFEIQSPNEQRNTLARFASLRDAFVADSVAGGSGGLDNDVRIYTLDLQRKRAEEIRAEQQGNKSVVLETQFPQQQQQEEEMTFGYEPHISPTPSPQPAPRKRRQATPEGREASSPPFSPTTKQEIRHQHRNFQQQLSAASSTMKAEILYMQQHELADLRAQYQRMTLDELLQLYEQQQHTGPATDQTLVQLARRDVLTAVMTEKQRLEDREFSQRETAYGDMFYPELYRTWKAKYAGRNNLSRIDRRDSEAMLQIYNDKKASISTRYTKAFRRYLKMNYDTLREAYDLHADQGAQPRNELELADGRALERAYDFRMKRLAAGN